MFCVLLKSFLKFRLPQFGLTENAKRVRAKRLGAARNSAAYTVDAVVLQKMDKVSNAVAHDRVWHAG